MTNKKKFITPTKENPVFEVLCSDFGYIDNGIYEDYGILLGTVCGFTFGTKYAKSISDLHAFIVEFYSEKSDRKNLKFTLNLVDGSLDKYGEISKKAVYTISGNKLDLLFL